MKTIELLSFIILSIITSILCLTVLAFFIIFGIVGHSVNITSKISADKIKEIELGMNFEEVISILGKPYEIDILGTTHSSICRNPKLYFEMPVNKNMDIIDIVDRIYSDTSYCCDTYEQQFYARF